MRRLHTKSPFVSSSSSTSTTLLSALLKSSTALNSSSLLTPGHATPSMDHVLSKQEKATLWGATSGTFVDDSADAQLFLTRMQYDPVLSTAAVSSPVLSRSQEDGLGTDLNSEDPVLLKESENLWKTERGSQFLSALRRIRARGAGSSIGFARLSSPRDATDEADRAETTWARDSQFTDAANAINDITGVSAPNMETLVTAVKRATPEQLTQLYSNYRGLQPYSFLPVPSEAGWALRGEELSKWCEKFSAARSAADQFNADVLNNAVVAAGGWSSIASKLADQFKKVCEVQKARRERQVKNSIRKEWSKMTHAEKELCAQQDITRQIQSEQTGEYDAAGNEDTSEDFLLEHDKIEKIIDEDIGGGVTFRKFWMNNERLYEGVHLQHVADASSTELRAACLLRARNELGFDRLDKDLEVAIRNSNFDNKGHFVVPDMTTRGWRMTRWHLFGASKTVVQHTSSSSRILDNRFQTLEGTAAVAKLFYRLLPLSSSIDLSSPFKHRKSLVTVAADFIVEVDRANQIRATRGLKTLDSAVAQNEKLVSLFGAPLGASRRIANEQLRAELTKNDVKINKIAFGTTIDSAKDSISTWKMGTYQDVAFDWPTPLLDSTDPQLSAVAPGTVDAVLIRENLRQQRTCITVALMRKRTKDEIEQAKKQMESEVIAPLMNAFKQSSSSSQNELIIRQIERVTGVSNVLSSEANLNQAVSLLKKEAESEWVFDRMLDDAVQPYPGESSCKVRMPFFSPSSPSSVEYRLDVRCFDLQQNPKRLPTRFVSKSSSTFKIADPVPEVMKKVAKVDISSSSSTPQNFNGNLLIDVCSALRKEGCDIPLMLEFEAGQNLTPKNEIITSYFLSLLTERNTNNSTTTSTSTSNIDTAIASFFRESGANRGITDIQLSIEPAVRRHYQLHHPGCTEQEWAENRRPILEQAIQEESEWWRQDSLLQLAPEILSPVAHPSTNSGHPEPQTCQSTLRYGRDVVQVLHASGRDGTQHSGDDASPAVARVSMRGDGATVSLNIDQHVCTERALKLDQVLNAVKEASNSAHVRLNTLAEAKLGTTRHEVQRLYVDFADSTDFGGVYSKTVVRSFQQAEEMIGLRSGEVTSELDRVRSDEGPVDRFASKDDVMLRKKLFSHRVGNAGENVDDADHNTSNSSVTENMMDQW